MSKVWIFIACGKRTSRGRGTRAMGSHAAGNLGFGGEELGARVLGVSGPNDNACRIFSVALNPIASRIKTAAIAENTAPARIVTTAKGSKNTTHRYRLVMERTRAVGARKSYPQLEHIEVDVTLSATAAQRGHTVSFTWNLYSDLVPPTIVANQIWNG